MFDVLIPLVDLIDLICELELDSETECFIVQLPLTAAADDDVFLGVERVVDVFDVEGDGPELAEPALDGVVLDAAALDGVAEHGLDPLPPVVELPEVGFNAVGPLLLCFGPEDDLFAFFDGAVHYLLAELLYELPTEDLERIGHFLLGFQSLDREREREGE